MPNSGPNDGRPARALRFEALTDPAPELTRAAAEAAPENPMATPAFAAALRATGHPPMLLAGWDGKRLTAACYATLRQGRARRTLAVESWPGGAPAGFAEGFARLCDQVRADVVEVSTFGSPAGALPALPGRAQRRARLEHLWDLTAPELRAGLASNHKRNVTRSTKAGVVVAERADAAALAAHAGLTAASLTRRTDRGEAVSSGGTPTAWWQALAAAGAARVFQASAADGEVVSSILVLRAARGAYYQSAGTSPRGMELGASPFLVLHVARQLAAEGCTVFNLGGAEESNAGLYRFKTGFGTRPVALESARFEHARSWRARAVGALRAVRAVARPGASVEPA